MIHTIADILVVEDDSANRDIMMWRMQGTNYSIRFAITGQEALDQVAAKKPDLILLDVMLPDCPRWRVRRHRWSAPPGR